MHYYYILSPYTGYQHKHKNIVNINMASMFTTRTLFLLSYLLLLINVQFKKNNNLLHLINVRSTVGNIAKIIYNAASSPTETKYHGVQRAKTRSLRNYL